MKKILFFINSLAGGGAEKVLINLLQSLDPQKYEIDLISVTGGTFERDLSEIVNYKTVLRSKNKFINKWSKKIIYNLPFWIVRKILIKKKYDIEVAYLEGFPTRVVSTNSFSPKTKKIAFVHCDVSVKPVLNDFYKSKAECIHEYRCFDKVCFVSQKALLGFEKAFAPLDNSIIIHNVVNEEEILNKSEAKNDFEFSTNGLKLISVGRLSSEKGYERLIKTVGELEKKYEFELWILGEGPERARLEQLITELGISSVKLLGFQENPYSYMKKADLYICPSYFEGYSTTVTECMLLKIPVLTTDCAGMDEILDNGKYGKITENSDEALLDGLIEFFENKEILNTYRENLKAYQFDNNVENYDMLFQAMGDL